jgi:hypothetical protein
VAERTSRTVVAPIKVYSHLRRRAKARYRCYDFLVGARDFIQRGSSARSEFLRAQLPPLAITAASLTVSSTFPKSLSAAVPEWVKARHNIADEILQWCDAVPDTQTYRNLALHRPAYVSSSHDYNLTAQLVTDGIIDTKSPRWVAVSSSLSGTLARKDREHLIEQEPPSPEWT